MRATLHHNADRRVFGLQHRRLAADENCLAQVAQLQARVDTGCRLHVDFDGLAHVALKPGQFDLEPVGTRNKVEETIFTVAPAHALAALAGRGVRQHDGCARNYATLVVLHHADEGPVETLTHRWNWNYQTDEKQCGHSSDRITIQHAPS